MLAGIHSVNIHLMIQYLLGYHDVLMMMALKHPLQFSVISLNYFSYGFLLFLDRMDEGPVQYTGHRGSVPPARCVLRWYVWRDHLERGYCHTTIEV